MKESDDFVRAVARGFAVVEALGRPPGRHTLSEVADAAGISRAAARRILATLVTLRYCEPAGRYFQLRPRALGLGLCYLTAQPFWAGAQFLVEDLRKEVGESCALAVLDDAEIVYVARQPARRILPTHLGIGSRLPAHLVSLGRVLLAALTPSEREALFAGADLKALTPRSVTDPRCLEAELEKTAALDYAWVDGELDPSICGIAVPVRDRSGNVVAALSVNTISGTCGEEEAKARFLLPLKRAAQEIRARSGAVI